MRLLHIIIGDPREKGINYIYRLGKHHKIHNPRFLLMDPENAIKTPVEADNTTKNPDGLFITLGGASTALNVLHEITQTWFVIPSEIEVLLKLKYSDRIALSFSTTNMLETLKHVPLSYKGSNLLVYSKFLLLAKEQKIQLEEYRNAKS